MVVIGINMSFVYSTVMEFDASWSILVAIAIVVIFYILLCVYLSIHLIASLREDNLSSFPFVAKYVTTDEGRIAMDP